MLTFAILYAAIGLSLTFVVVAYGILRWGEKLEAVHLGKAALLALFWPLIVGWCAIDVYAEWRR
jgi:hypothetical protein